MARGSGVVLSALMLLTTACGTFANVTRSSNPTTQPISVAITVITPATGASDVYVPVPQRSATVLGCDSPSSAPVCEVALPSLEEDSAFHAEGTRLSSHLDSRCRQLGDAILANVSSVRMYRKALIRYSGQRRLYGVGHTYELDDTWMVRVARRLDDLNERTLDEKKRTLRHEMSHTIGATEDRIAGWSAEDYANACR